jgi:NitT/TauT family transport system substrate-binding protein
MKRLGIGLTLALLLVAIVLGEITAAEPLKIGYPTWVGYGPLFLARDKGFLKEEGVEVELVKMEDPKERFFALAAARLDGVASTIDTMGLYLKTGKEFQYVLALDDSAGGDGIVARKEITSVKDLKAKKVAFAEGSVSQFFLNVLLKEAGLTHGHVLVDSSKTPGLITDILIFRRDVIERRAREIQAVANAWNRAVAYWEKNPRESNEIMARAVGGWLKDPKVFEEVLTGIKFYNREANVKFFGTPAQPGLIHQTVQNALDTWGGFGKLQVKVPAKELINHSFVK